MHARTCRTAQLPQHTYTYNVNLHIHLHGTHNITNCLETHIQLAPMQMFMKVKLATCTQPCNIILSYHSHLVMAWVSHEHERQTTNTHAGVFRCFSTTGNMYPTMQYHNSTSQSSCSSMHAYIHLQHLIQLTHMQVCSDVSVQLATSTQPCNIIISHHNHLVMICSVLFQAHTLHIYMT